jgi:cell division protein FtsI (penicillin-binding protein 3)
MLFIRLIFLFGLIILVSRLIFLHIFQDNFLDEQIVLRSHSEYSLIASRGKILDRNSNILAFDVQSYSVGIDLSKLEKNNLKIDQIEKILNLESGKLLQLVEKRRKGFREIRRHVSAKIKTEIEELKVPGIFFRQTLRRSYPQKEISSHVVGITDIDRNGLQGAELVFDNILKGKKGSFDGVKSRGNKKIEGTRIEPENGQNVLLSIDIRLQSIAFEELQKAIIKNKASSGSIILVDPRTAQILALSNYPSFNPSNRKNIKDHSVFRNRSTIDVFEPGSVLKPIAMSAIIESGKVKVDAKVNTSPGWIEVAGYRTNDFKDYGLLDLSQIISLSSNVGMVKLCTDQEISHLTGYYSRFGIGRYPVNLIIPSREGFLAHHSEYTLRDKVSSCYGYGLSMSAIQIAQAYSVFANNGIYKELSLFLNDDSEPFKERVIKASTAKIIKEMLYQTVHSSEGTARKAKINGTTVAGKTGTAIEINSKSLSYTATFAGFSPINNPKLLGVVVLHGLKGEDHSGGRVAAPLFSRIVSQSLHLLEVAN